MTFSIQRATAWLHPKQHSLDSQKESSERHTDSYTERDPSVSDDIAGCTTDATHAWLPSSIQRESLAVFIVAFTILIVVLAVLFDYSNKHNGVASSRANLHYLWTYGPTAGEYRVRSEMTCAKLRAVFMVVAAFWTKVSFRYRQLAPWRSLAAGPACADRSVLLDYVSPSNPVALVRSMRFGHLDVSLAISATLLLQLIVIFSTGLFALEARTIYRSDVPVTTLVQFANTSAGVSARTFLTALAMRQFDLEHPLGSTDTFAYQTFNVSSAGLRK